MLTVAAEVLGRITPGKTTQKRSMRAAVRVLTVSGPARDLSAIEAARATAATPAGWRRSGLWRPTTSPSASNWRTLP